MAGGAGGICRAPCPGSGALGSLWLMRVWSPEFGCRDAQTSQGSVPCYLVLPRELGAPPNARKPRLRGWVKSEKPPPTNPTQGFEKQGLQQATREGLCAQGETPWGCGFYTLDSHLWNAFLTRNGPRTPTCKTQEVGWV